MTETAQADKVDQIILENEDLKSKLREAEETIEAIRNGEVDAIIVKGKHGESIYSLQTAETPYRIILEEMNEGALIVSVKGIVLYCNGRFAEMLSVPQEKIICSKITRLVSPNERNDFKNLLNEGLRKKTCGTISFITGKDKELHAQISIAALPQTLGGDISITVSDITQIKDHQILLEEMVEMRSAELNEANRKLSEDVIHLRRKEETIEAVARKYKILYDRMRESEDKYRDLVESANSIIMKTEMNGHISYMNRYGLRFFGYAEEEIIGSHVNDTIVPMRESTGRDLSHIVEEVLANPDRYLVFENENLRKDRSHAWISWTNKLTRDRKGNITGILAIGNDITDFKIAEKALKESESKYRTIVETANEGIISTDANGNFIYINNKIAEMIGYQPNDILGKSMADFVFDEDKEKALKMVSGNRITKTHGEFRFRRKNGSPLWVSYFTSPLLDSTGKFIGNLGMAADITEKKTANDILYKSEERFRTAFEKGAIPMALTSLKGDLIRVNQAFCSLTGFTHEELAGITFTQLTHPDDRKLNSEGFNRILSGEISSFRMEKRYVHKSGEIIWVDMSTAPVRDIYGNPDYMVTHLQDINERKKAENELKRFGEKLEIALDSGHIGIWEMNFKDKTVTWDARMGRIFNLDPGTFSGSESTFENMINEEDLPHFKKALSNSRETGALFETVFRTNPKNGTSKYVSTRALIGKDDYGIPVKMTGVCFDVTGMKEGAEKVIMKLNEELLRSNRELESFAYVASHDLQEPLRMVASYTQMLSQRYGHKLDQNAQDYIKFAVNGAKRMYDLINGLLSYSRIQTKGKEFLNVDMNSVFKKVINNLGLKIDEKNVRIRKNKLPVIFADESQMIQLVQNLMENAIKFSQNKPSLSFRAEEKEDHYLFSMKDNGIGIEPQYFERIFKIFQQLMSKDEYEGTGIGLAICKRIVERHGGKIWVESTPKKGSEFFFTIPKKMA